MPIDEKYHYSNSNIVWDKNKYKNPCFDGINDPYYLKSVMNKENTIAWLNEIKKVIPFEYKLQIGIDNYQYKEDLFVYIVPPKTTFEFLIFFGNLTKGVSEYAFFCEKHLKDTSDDPFFVKSWKAFKSMSQEDLIEVNYNDRHGWFNWKDSKSSYYPKESKTIEETLKKFNDLCPKAGLVWSTIL